MKKLNLAAKNLDETNKKLDDWVENRVVPTQPEKEKKLTVRMSATLHKKFKQQTLAEDKNMNEVVTEIIDNWCQGNILQLPPDVYQKLQKKALVSGLTPLEAVASLIEKWCE